MLQGGFGAAWTTLQLARSTIHGPRGKGTCLRAEGVLFSRYEPRGEQ